MFFSMLFEDSKSAIVRATNSDLTSDSLVSMFKLRLISERYFIIGSSTSSICDLSGTSPLQLIELLPRYRFC